MRYQFVDCGWDLSKPERGRELYLSAHIPGASFLDVEGELSDLAVTDAGRHPLPSADRFAASASRAGIGADVFVIGYDQGTGGGAARLWWLLRHFGHDQAAVVEGGLAAWSGPLGRGEETIELASLKPRPRTGDTIEAGELAARLDEDGLVIVDARAPDRYRGDFEPIDPVAGRIPGAVNWPYSARASVPDEILTAEEIVVYCGSGITSCVNLHALALAGRADAKLYSGSWSDWCRRGLPSERG